MANNRALEWDTNYFTSQQFRYWKLIFQGAQWVTRNGERHFILLYDGLYFKYPEMFKNWYEGAK